MPRYNVTVYYTGREGFTVEAASPEQAIQFVREGNPEDTEVPGERDFDEYMETTRLEVYADGTDNILLEKDL